MAHTLFQTNILKLIKNSPKTSPQLENSSNATSGKPPKVRKRVSNQIFFIFDILKRYKKNGKFQLILKIKNLQNLKNSKFEKLVENHHYTHFACEYQYEQKNQNLIPSRPISRH